MQILHMTCDGNVTVEPIWQEEYVLCCVQFTFSNRSLIFEKMANIYIYIFVESLECKFF